MEFPLDMLTEFYIDGAWVRVPTYERDVVEIEHGKPDRATTTDPGRLSITVNNRDGHFSPRNPMSPHFGKIGRNTRVRFSLPGGTPRLELDGDPGSLASTPDHASLDITGDLDLRWEGEIDWYASGAQMLMGKWSADPGNRSYNLRLQDGDAFVHFSSDGTGGQWGVWTLPPLPRHAALRGTVDVNNGAGGWTANLYWAETLDGPWTKIGGDAVSTPTATVFSGTAPLAVAPNQIASTPPRYPMTGQAHRVEVRSGINGTVVANPDFTAQAAGVSSFTDGAGRTWALSGNAAIRDRHDLFVGEVSEWPQKWTPDGADAWVPMEAAGILRRMGQGKKPLQSTLFRAISRATPLAYWPMEEGQNATQAYSPIPGVAPLSLTGADWASASTLASSAPLPALQSADQSSVLLGRVPSPGGTLTSWSVNFVYRIDTAPATLRTALRILTSGTVAQWLIQMSSANSRIVGYDGEGATVVENNINTSSDIFNAWVRIRFTVTQSGSNTNWRVDWFDVTGNNGGFGASVAGSPGRPTSVASPTGGYSSDLNGMALGHISVWPSDEVFGYAGAFGAWSGETAPQRMLRLASEENVPLAFAPGPVAAELVGPQKLEALLNLFQEAADADGGMLLELRSRPGLLYRERSSMYSQAPKLALSYDRAPGLAAPFEPVDDDTTVRNDRTVKRDGGSEGRAVLEEGPLSVQNPPAGIGLYDDSVTLSLHSDTQAEPIAYWRLWLGTQDTPRYPTVKILLHKAPALIPAVLALNEGDLVRITDLPKWVGFGDVDLIVDGIHHAASLMQWTVTLNCQPADPWRVGVVGDAALGRADVDEGGSTLALPTSETDPQLLVHTPALGVAGALPWIASAGPAPTYPSEFPFDVRFGGETARVTGCVPSAYDAFGRTVTGGWGIADCGFTWVGSQGAASDRSVTGGAGVVTLAAAPDTTRFQRLVSNIGDAEVLVRMSVSQLATGAGFIPGVLLRYVDDTNFYRARVHLNPGGTMTAAITRDYSAVGSTPTLPWTYTAGAWFWVRARVTGHLMQMRVWPDAQREPTVWHKEATITTSPIAAGQIGVSASSFAGNTNTNPALRFDDFQVVTPQILTVERSLNGVVKAHAAGTGLSLANPAHAGL
ncbi:hypothetical protein TPA0906_34860 [Streptomyces olivaceus]|uniref:hypothetical protein n=1 Tax=Streptomyces olivaceus TaxID=47716 RepID=UPI0022EDD904|nr:hypothetical protein [Streptomyces olivaceus]GHJ01621.1 hypothetical protein TPA0906_34860 [Streptomyces olivaceus]